MIPSPQFEERRPIMAGVAMHTKQAEFICDVCHKPGVGNVNQKRHVKPCRRQKLQQIRDAARGQLNGLILRITLKKGGILHASLPNDLLHFDLKTSGITASLPGGKRRQVYASQVASATVISVLGKKRAACSQ
jgi:hypothetical protein